MGVEQDVPASEGFVDDSGDEGLDLEAVEGETAI